MTGVFSAKKTFILPLILILSGMLIFAQTEGKKYTDYDALIEQLMKEQEIRDKEEDQKKALEQEQKQELEQTQAVEEETIEGEFEEANSESSQSEQLPEPVEGPPEEPAEPALPEPVEGPPEEPVESEPEPVLPEPVEGPPEEEKHTYEALAMIRYKNTDNICFKLKISYIPKPYILAISLAAGYSANKLIQPFYFGGYIEPHIGIPQKKFPFKYEQDGKTISGPLIMGGKLYAPFGICVFPFQRNIEVFIEVEPGITFDFLWNAKFGKKAITSRLYPAFYAAIRTGATYKGFTAFLEGNYDAILGFGVSLGVGYNLSIQYTSKADQTDSAEEAASQ